jgi:hypothetical protein
LRQKNIENISNRIRHLKIKFKETKNNYDTSLFKTNFDFSVYYWLLRKKIMEAEGGIYAKVD